MTGAGGPRTVGTMGTPAYMAPEQWGDAGKVDWRADIYSLGCLVFEMATGRPPFVAASFAEACGMHLGSPPPKLRTIAPDLPEALETMIDAMLAKSPYSRPPLRDIAKMFSDLGSGQPYVASPTSSAAITPPPVAPTLAADAPTHAPVVHQPTPVSHQTPQHTTPNHPTPHHPTPQPATPSPPTPSSASPAPVASSPAIPVQPPAIPVQSVATPASSVKSVPPQSASTTLSSAAGTAAPENKSRTAIYAIAGIVVIGGGIAAIVAASSGGGGGKKKTASDPIASPPPVADAAVEIADAPSTPPPTWTKPVFSDINGSQVMPRQVTRAMYKDYLGSLAKPDAAKATPLKDWSDARPDEPVGWVSFEQATGFCTAAGGSLPTNTTWLAIAKGSWHIGPALKDPKDGDARVPRLDVDGHRRWARPRPRWHLEDARGLTHDGGEESAVEADRGERRTESLGREHRERDDRHSLRQR